MPDNADMTPSRDDKRKRCTADFLRQAAAANEAGDSMLAMHLFLAAFEEAAGISGAPDESAIVGLKNAWVLACENKERALAEYIFEKMEPYLSTDEIAICTEQLQDLAFDKLEELGLSREDLENMTEMISQDFLGMDAHVVKVESLFSGPFDLPGDAKAASFALPSPAEIASSFKASIQNLQKEDEEHPAAETLCVADSAEANQNQHDREGEPKDAAEPAEPAEAESPREQSSPAKTPPLTVSPVTMFAHAVSDHEEPAVLEPPLNYDALAGYGHIISIVRDFGIGMKDDPAFKQLVAQLNQAHGLEAMPAADSLLFRSPAREDAMRFVEATIGELKLPALRMHMEDGLQGMPVLCVSALASDVPKINPLRNALSNGGVLVLEDLDLWTPPLPDFMEDPSSFFMAQFTRGAREAISLIRSSVENPDVYVLATASTDGDIDGFFLDLMEPLSIIDIDYPNDEERLEIWEDIAATHPSMAHLDRHELVRFSAHMPRFDIYMATREAVEEAYKFGLMAREYQPVSRENIYEKLAAYQPLDSREYRELEEAVLSSFHDELEHLEDLLGGDRWS